MTEARDSYRQILRSSFIVGGAMVVTIVIGLVRGKVAALLLGPAGLGLVGLYQSLMSLGATVAGLGLRTVGTRQIAEAVGKNDDAAVGAARRALFWGTVGLAAIGALVIWLARHIIAVELLRDASLAGDVGLIGIGVAFTVAAGSQTALLTGLRRIGDLTRVNVGSALVAAAIGCTVVALYREQGIVAFVIVAPAATFVFGYWRIARLRLAAAAPTPFAHLTRQWRTMAGIGVAFMMSSLVAVGSEFFVRALIQRHLGAAALGQFYAAWTISSTYLGLVLAAMGADYYPRLTATVGDHAAAKRLVNEQTEIVLLLAAPVLLAIIGLAPFVTHILYSRDFAEAAAVLRWQALGDVAMVVIWPLGYLLLARGRGSTYFWSEAIPLGLFMAATSIMLPIFGVRAAGGAFLLMTVFHLALAHWLAWRGAGWLAWNREVTRHFAVLCGAALAVFLASLYSDLVGGGLGVVLAAIAGVYAIVRFSSMVGTQAHDRVVAILRMGKRFVGIGSMTDAPSPAARQADHPHYRPDIDGLRAVAVLSVLVFHAAPGRLPGGFVGVDIFFVISGFLITSIIVSGLDRDRFSFADFYARRIRRIFPALALVLATCLLAGILLFTDDELAALGKHVAGGAGFVSNLVLWSEAGYFDAAADFKPLLHLWSLGVEEQFYIVWPALLMLASRIERRRSTAFVVIGALAAASFGWSVYQSLTAPVAAFYSPLSRFWEPFLGALLAVWTLRRRPRLAPAAANAVSWAGLGMIVAAIALIDASKPFPGLWAALPTLGAAALILAGPIGWVNRRVLSLRPMVWVGLISYPLYLWHWPLIALPRILEGGETAQWKRFVGVALAIPLAWLTYVLVEKPIRRGAGGRLAAPLLAGIVALLALIGGFAWSNGGIGHRSWAPRIVNVGETDAPPFFAYVSAHYFPCNPPEIRRLAQAGESFMRCPQSKPASNPDFALIGDSHAESLFPGVADALPGRNVVFYGVGEGLPFVSNPDYAKVFDYVTRSPDIRSVLITAVWPRKLKPIAIDAWRADLTATIARLRSAGKTVYLADDVPTFSFMPNRCKFDGRLGAKNLCAEKDVNYEAVYTPVFDEIARTTGAHRILLHPLFCSDGTCAMARGGVLYFRDQHHLDIAGSKLAGASIARTIAATESAAAVTR